MPVKHRTIHLSNLPVNIPEDKIIAAVKAVLQEDNPSDSFKDMRVRVLPVRVSRTGERATPQQWAIIYNVDLSPKSMQLLQLRPVHLEHNRQTRIIVWHFDTLQFYDHNWQPKATMSPSQIRNLQLTLFGSNHRKITGIFEPGFLEKINLKVWDAHSNSVRLDVSKYEFRNDSNWNKLFRSGSEAFHEYKLAFPSGPSSGVVNPISIKVTYGSPLDTIQCIRKLNRNTTLLGNEHCFIPLFGKSQRSCPEYYANQLSSCEYNSYMGDGGAKLNTLELVRSHGFAPSDAFDKSSVRFEAINKAMESSPNEAILCHACGERYKVIGTSIDFSWLAAQCKCDYGSAYAHDAKTLANNQPVRWRNETFTRLVLFCDADRKNSSASDLLQRLTVHHEPLLLKYESPLEYAIINSTLFKAEDIYQKAQLSTQFVQCPESTSWSQSDRVLGYWFPKIPPSELGAEEDIAVLESVLERKIQEKLEMYENPAEAQASFQIILKKIKVPISHFPNVSKIKSWTAEDGKLRNVQIRGTRFNGTRAKVVNSQIVDGGTAIEMSLKFRWKGTFVPENARVNTMHPLTDISEYLRSLALLKKFADFDSELVNTFLGIAAAGEYEQDVSVDWAPGIASLSVEHREKIRSVIRQGLHQSQLEALDLGLSRSMLLVQGPPGTGKTTTLCSMAFTILMENQGRILVLCPSNTAADNVARAIEYFKLKLNAFGVHGVTAVRMYSNSRQNRMISKGMRKNFPTLHADARNSSLWARLLTRFPNLDEIRWGMETSQEIYVDLYEQQSEQIVLQKCSIVVATLSAALDGRLQNFIGKFSTVMVDECSQALEFQLLTALTFKPKRCLFFGDHNQLPATVTSPSCIVSGFQLSFLERALLCNRLQRIRAEPDIFPFVMLREQFRMDASIASIVSELFYGGMVETSSSVLTRKKPEYFSKLTSSTDKLDKSQVLFIPVRTGGTEGERSDGTSKFNAAEVSSILHFVRWLLKNNVPPASIRIISNYEAQRSKLVAAITREFPLDASDIIIQTVDGSQGDEADLCIYSTVRTYKEAANYEFLMEKQRLCVALSRAKYGLFIFGDLDIFQKVNSQVIKTFKRMIIDPGHVLEVENILSG